jgi:hypothetical protein
MVQVNKKVKEVSCSPNQLSVHMVSIWTIILVTTKVEVSSVFAERTLRLLGFFFYRKDESQALKFHNCP